LLGQIKLRVTSSGFKKYVVAAKLHCAEPSYEVRSELQGVQLVEPLNAAYLPAKQEVQSELPEKLYFPAGHSTHLKLEENFPASHEVHAVEPVTVTVDPLPVYEPDEQSRHSS
jgi:hypothetical protein